MTDPTSVKQCGSSFTLVSSYRRHIKLHIGRKPYECNICQKRFPERYKLKNHIIKHTEFEDIKDQQLDTLKMDRLREQCKTRDEGRHICTVCGERFGKMKGLKRHAKYHEEPSYRCVPCGKGFVERFKLKIHMKVHHSVKEEMFEELILKEQFVNILTGNSDQQLKDCEMIFDSTVNSEKADKGISLDCEGSNMLNKGDYNRENTHVLYDQNLHFGGQQLPAGISDGHGTTDMVPWQEQGARTIVFEHDAQYFVGKDVIEQEIVIESEIKEKIRCKDETAMVSSVSDVNKCISRDKCNANQVRCVTCGQTFCNQDNLMEHLMKDMQSALLTCKICGMVCISAKALEDHKLTHNDQAMESKNNQTDQTQGGSCYLNMFTQDSSDKDDSVEDGSDNAICLQNKENELPEIMNTAMNDNRVMQKIVYGGDGNVTGSDERNIDVSQATTGTAYVKENHPIVKIGFQCGICGKGFQTSFALRMHNMMHDDAVSTQIGDDNDDLTGFDDNSEVDNDEHDYNTDNTDSYCNMPHPCKICNEKFSSESMLLLHVKKVHQDARVTLRCSLCGKGFPTMVALRLHKMMRENDDEMHVGSRVNAEKRTFQCNNCGKSFKNSHRLQHHFLIHTDEKPHSCNICGESFRYKERMLRHMRTHTGEKPFQCEVCSKVCATRATLRDHMMIHTGEKPFKCTVCNKCFRKGADLKKHQYSHVAMDERPFQCSVCVRSFGEKRRLQEHMKTHTGEKPFQCNLCDAAFARQDGLNNHYLLHTGDKPHKCTLCSKAFRLPEQLRTHLVVHSDKRPFSCELCGLAFKCRNTLRFHTKVHSDQKPFQCDHCGQSFRTSSYLKSHKLVHSKDKPIKCIECGKGFTRQSRLKEHMANTHFNEKNHVCSTCGKAFALLRGLRQHQKFAHTEERPFACTKCNLTFKRKAALQNHVLTHSDGTPFTCQICGKVFKLHRYLMEHTKRHLHSFKGNLVVS